MIVLPTSQGDIMDFDTDRIDRLTEDELDWLLEAEAVALMGD